MTATADLAGFEQTYRAHVAMVRAGDLKGVMADMLPSALPAVFEGVDTPRDAVLETDIRDARLEGDRAVGECVYTMASASIGLRSGWVHDGSAWKADTLENFEV